MQDYKLDVEVKVVIRPVKNRLGAEGGPQERASGVLVQKATKQFVGTKAEVDTLVDNAILTLTANRGLLAAKAPEVTEGVATSTSNSAEVITASGHDHGTSTTASVVWGITREPVTPQAAHAGGTITGDGWSEYHCDITGLAASTKYYYRTKVTSAGGTVYGPLRTFTTIA